MIEVIIKCSDDVRGSKNIYGELLQEIVRCKDCEYGEVLDEYESGSCSNSTGLIGYITKDDFCSYGVAKMKGGTE